MKNLLKKLVFEGAPAEGAVFATLLFWLGTWCLASVFLVADGLPACFPGAVGMSPYGKPAFAWQNLLWIAEGLLCLYYLSVTYYFYWGLSREKWPFGKYVLIGSYLLLIASCLFSRGGEFFVIAVYLVCCWTVPLVFMPKQWKWLIPAALTPLCFLPMAVTFIDTVFGFLLGQEVPAVWRWSCLPNGWLFYLLCLFAVFCIICRLKACAAAAGKPLRALFGKGAAAVCGVFLVTYLVTLGMAYTAHCRTERHVAELEKFFGRPVTAQGLRELYFQNRKPDAAFWQRAVKLHRPGYRLRWVFDSATELTPAEFAACRKEFENFAELRELEKMFAGPLPACDRKLVPGCLLAEKMPDLEVEHFCLYEQWRVRFALADRDPAAALAAVKRMKFCRDHLARDPVLLAALVLCGIENYRLDALERLLSSGLLNQGQLREMRAELAACRGEMKKIHAQAVYGEAVSAMDLCQFFAYGGKVRDGKTERVSPGLYASRRAFPAMWYVFTRNRDVLAQAYKTEDFFHLPYREERSVSHFLPRIMLAGMRASGRRFHALADRYLAMETLIGVELEKRRTGKYPDVLKDPPKDSFGEELLYRKGKLPFIRRHWNAEKKELEPHKVMADVVAVWSKGPNRKDDQGLYEKVFSADGNPDDSRAFIFLKPRQ
ncbi:MAG: hypothetical protein IJT50_04810 [Lentisphaeria bacterium]|nr:hypothetical protein [Lentisphaeria bacterium]